MNANLKIISTYENKQIELILNESFLCPIRDIGIIDLLLGAEIVNWKVRLFFDKNESSPVYSSKWEFGVDNFDIKVTFFNWMASSAIELKAPYLVKTVDGSKQFYFKFKTEAKSESEFSRTVHLSIWKVI